MVSTIIPKVLFAYRFPFSVNLHLLEGGNKVRSYQKEGIND